MKYAAISDIDFSAPSTKRKRLDKKNQSEESTLLSFSPSNIAAAEDPTDTELDKLYETISKTEDKPAILSIIPKHCDQYVINHSVVSTPLSALFQAKYVCLSYDALLRECDLAFTKLTLNQEQARNIELSTRGQALSKDWFRYRTGHVTASRLKSPVRTDPTRPSILLIREIKKSTYA